MAKVDVLLYVPAAMRETCEDRPRDGREGAGDDVRARRASLSPRFANTPEGVESMRPVRRGGGNLLEVVYDPARTDARAILDALENGGCRARLIGL